jgi:hypothetical protein
VPKGAEREIPNKNHYISEPGSERQRSHVVSHVWEIDTMQMQTVLWKTSHTKGRSEAGERGKKKEVEKVDMVDILSI